MGMSELAVRREALLLDAFEQQLATTRLSDLSVEQIAAAAGITRTRFYRYFDSKYDMLAAALRRIADELVGVYLEPGSWWVRPDDVAPRAALGASFDTIRVLWEKHGPLLREASDLWNAVPEARATWENVFARLTELTAAQIERDRKIGLAPPGPPATDLARVLLWGGERVLFLWQIESSEGLATEPLREVLLSEWIRSIYLADDPQP
jgi:TetR/AcrR family transcriptional regulator, ethionamide resistance regulator